MSAPAQPVPDVKACTDRLKEVAAGATKVTLIWLAALLFIWATKIEPGFGPVHQYENSVKRKENAEHTFRHHLNILKRKFGEHDPDATWALKRKDDEVKKKPDHPPAWVIEQKTPFEGARSKLPDEEGKDEDTDGPSATGEQPQKSYVGPALAQRDTPMVKPADVRPAKPVVLESAKPTVVVAAPAVVEPPAAAAIDQDDEENAESPSDPRAPTKSDHRRLKQMNRAFATLLKTSLEAEAKKVSATKVDFELLSYKFQSYLLYAPLIWNLTFLGLLFYLFFSRLRLISLLVATVERGSPERMYHASWWIAPLPYVESDNYVFERMGKTTGWGEGSRGPIIAVAVMLILATILQGRVLQIGLAVTKLLGSGREATWLTISYYATFLAFAFVVLRWIFPARYRSQNI